MSLAVVVALVFPYILICDASSQYTLRFAWSVRCVFLPHGIVIRDYCEVFLRNASPESQVVSSIEIEVNASLSMHRPYLDFPFLLVANDEVLVGQLFHDRKKLKADIKELDESRAGFRAAEVADYLLQRICLFYRAFDNEEVLEYCRGLPGGNESECVTHASGWQERAAECELWLMGTAMRSRMSVTVNDKIALPCRGRMCDGR